MCLAPITLPNPYFSADPIYVRGDTPFVSPAGKLASAKPTIQVPCGHCEECKQRKINDIVVRAYIESQTSYVYNIMLSYDNQHIPLATLHSASDVQPELTFAYGDYSHIQNMFKRFRRCEFLDGRDFRYVVAGEFGEKKHRPHWHLMLFIAKRSSDNCEVPYVYETLIKENLLKCYSVNKGSDKAPVYEPLLTPRTLVRNGKTYTNYLVKYVPTLLEDAQADDEEHVPISNYIGYLAKYFHKDDAFSASFIERLVEQCDLDMLQTKVLKDIVKPKLHFSKNFGLGFFPNGEKVVVPPANQRLIMKNTTLQKAVEVAEFQDYVNSASTSYVAQGLFKELYQLVERGHLKSHKHLHAFFNNDQLRFLEAALAFSKSVRRRVKDICPDFIVPTRYEPNEVALSAIRHHTFDLGVGYSRCYAIVRQAIRQSIDETRQNFYTITLTMPKKTLTFVLPAFYRRRFLTLDDQHEFLRKRKVQTIDGLVFPQRSAERVEQAAARLERRREYLNAQVEAARQENILGHVDLPYDVAVLDYDAVFHVEHTLYQQINQLAEVRERARI